MSCCRFSRNWRKPWRLGWTPAKRFPDQPQNLLYALRCKQYLLAWARKWRMAGSNPWCIIQPRRCLWKAVFHDHASPRTADFFVNNHRGLELRFGIQRVGMKTCRASLLGKQCKGSNRTTVPCAPANVRTALSHVLYRHKQGNCIGGCRESKRQWKSSWNWQTDSRSSSWVQQHRPFMFCEGMPAKTQACRALQLDCSLRWARFELEKNTKPSKSKHPNSRRMPSGTHTKLYICTVNIPYFLMPKATESAKQAGKNHYGASPS